MKTFSDLKIPAAVITALRDRHDIHEPTAVQALAIPPIRSGADVIVQAPTGTGKTLAFLLPLLERVKAKASEPQLLVITPTRELAMQIAGVARTLCPLYGLSTLLVCGGQDILRQKEKLAHGAQVIIGTPGRLLDHQRHGALALTNTNKIVIDEADEMLKRGFLDDAETLLASLARDRQTVLTSATFPDRVKGLARRFLRRPLMLSTENATVSGSDVTLAPESIAQTVIETAEDDKLRRLRKLIDSEAPYLMMVFCATKERVQTLTLQLAERGYNVDALHGDMTQVQRKFVLRQFRDARLQILVTTDLAARGLDIEGVTHVVNFDMPRSTVDYIHRIGRTGRAGRDGVATTFVTPQQYTKWREITAGMRKRITVAKQERRRPRRKPLGKNDSGQPKTLRRNRSSWQKTRSKSKRSR